MEMVTTVKPQHPAILESSKEPWPPNYVAVFRERLTRLRNIEQHGFQEKALAYYSLNPVEFINHWCITFDPRNIAKDLPQALPFILFEKQVELVNWLWRHVTDQEPGLIEKSRDMGATWVCSAFSVWMFLFQPGTSVGWGSRKEKLVYNSGDPDAIFEKIKMILQYLPSWFLPVGWIPDRHMIKLKFLNPVNGSTITGEAGDQIGRGGRKTIFFKDESAHYERAESIAAALSHNTNVEIDISSVNGAGNLFYRTRNSGSTDIFIMDWRDHPAKDQAWYDKGKQDHEDKGIGHIWAQEVDRDYLAAVENILIPPKYVAASIDAHKRLGFEAIGMKQFGFDVADEGGDKNSTVGRHGVVVNFCDIWGEGDAGESTNKAVNQALEYEADHLAYDSIGVGAAVKAETNRILKDFQDIEMEISGWNAGGSVDAPNKEFVKGKKNKDMFANAKAQEWWRLLARFKKTYDMVNGKKEYPVDELISISSELEHLESLRLELSRPKRDFDGTGRVKVESKKEMRKRGVESPNGADALILAFVNREPKREIRVAVI